VAAGAQEADDDDDDDEVFVGEAQPLVFTDVSVDQPEPELVSPPVRSPLVPSVNSVSLGAGVQSRRVKTVQPRPVTPSAVASVPSTAASSDSVRAWRRADAPSAAAKAILPRIRVFDPTAPVAPKPSTWAVARANEVAKTRTADSDKTGERGAMKTRASAPLKVPGADSKKLAAKESVKARPVVKKKAPVKKAMTAKAKKGQPAKKVASKKNQVKTKIKAALKKATVAKKKAPPKKKVSKKK
jgi:hypothetical protein